MDDELQPASGHYQPLAGATELLNSGWTWDLSVNETRARRLRGCAKIESVDKLP